MKLKKVTINGKVYFEEVTETAEPDSAETEEEVQEQEQEPEEVQATPLPEPETATTVKPGYLLPPFFLLFIGTLCFMLNRSAKKD